ncbi:MAG: response regulator [Planctomycetes bacterium]|nr:response regulator [Planctomycetota bacterium]
MVILHVDDSLAATNLLSEVILEGDFAATLVSHSDAASALRWLATASPLPDFVLADLRMPGIDGLAFLRALAKDERTRAIPSALLTGSDDPRDLERIAAAGITRVLRKPQDMASYFELLRQIGEIASRGGRTRSGRYLAAIAPPPLDPPPPEPAT